MIGSPRGKSQFKNQFSPINLKSHDKERHVLSSETYAFLERDGFDRSRLDLAVDRGDIRKYSFKGQEYFDRLDVGRVFHDTPKNPKGMTIERYFSKEDEDPYLSAGKYTTRNLSIKDYKTGNEVFRMEAQFPESWYNEVANGIVAQKYFYKPSEEGWKEKLRTKIGVEHENSPKHLIERVTQFFVQEGEALGYFRTKKDKEVFADELRALQINKRFAFNSPVQFNAGIFHEYGVTGSTGINYWRDPKTGEIKKIEEGNNVKPQCHACFIIGPNDDLESIMNHAVNEAGIFSSGSGVGQDIGALREEGAPLSGGGKASGPMSFFKIYDDGAGTIKSGGKSRRAARMTTMRYNHPDIMKFVQGKVGEDKKALVLMEQGYSPGMDGEAYTTVTYQNTNISVRADKHFFDQVRKDGEIELRSVKDGKIIKKMSARRMLQEISFGSWRIGDPAIQYESLIQEMHPCKNSGRQNSTNPCSEYLFLDNTSCNLASLNLLEFSDEKGKFDVESFKRAARIVAIAQDIANDAASYPVEAIARISPEFRTIGLGYANLGAFLMRNGIAYDSEKGRNVAAAITAVMTGTAYEASAEMAENLGTFTHFEFNKKPFMEVMKKHRGHLEGIVEKHVPKDIMNAAREVWNNVIKKGEKHGFRNAQTTVLAPTGTISYLMDCDTTGVEPGISLIINKDLAGSGSITLVNNEVPNALVNLGYSQNEISEISAFITQRNTVRGAPHMNPDHYSVFDTAFGNSRGEGSINFRGHVSMLGATQPFISGAISKTNNMPESATVKDIYDGYLLGEELGLKALAVFRNNSKPISALNFGGRSYRKLGRGEKEDLPPMRLAFETEAKIGGKTFHIIVSEYDNGRPGQIAFLSFKSGSDMGALLTTSGVAASRALKRGMKLEDVLDVWRGHEFEPKGLVLGHPYIKTACSPLDFAAKAILIEYQGRKDLAEEPEKVEITKLRGFKNGAFRTYAREKVDSWNIEQVLKDSELGGFVKSNSQLLSSSVQSDSRGDGILCGNCGKTMRKTAPNCYSCTNCGDKVGGCGQ